MDSTLARYRTLLDIFESIAAHRRLGDFFKAVSQSLASTIPFDGIGVSLYEEESQKTQLYLLETDVQSDIPIGQTFSGEEAATAAVLQTGIPFYASDLESEQRFPAVNLMLRRHGIRSYCVIPLSTARYP